MPAQYEIEELATRLTNSTKKEQDRILKGFKEEFDGRWLIQRAIATLDPNRVATAKYSLFSILTSDYDASNPSKTQSWSSVHGVISTIQAMTKKTAHQHSRQMTQEEAKYIISRIILAEPKNATKRLSDIRDILNGTPPRKLGGATNVAESARSNRALL